MNSNRKFTAGAAALTAIAMGALLALPAAATHGTGLQQRARALLEGGTVNLNAGGVAEICYGKTCTTENIPVTADSVGVTLDYTLAKNDAHLPSVDVAAGVPAECKDAVTGVSRAGAILDLGAGSYQSLSGVALTTVDKNGKEERKDVLPQGNRVNQPVDPEVVKICLLGVASR